ncbi:MAG: methyltransferase domain-containing protein [Gammaproteobacteria bacterium]|nr:methyltransferase domain-containing protein [Gammaproteobacteria bacterium]NND39707.1 methyltransferase domain-containing protein [Pseudomonadales bacterium]MBT8150668.1 methyltransferase domain-containing protein [Gammaproteobacteria bacterium]NNL10301.1 methyltransferase domain-containing protein [Pseudomonadales bacterium]NNM12616.1 methyltransferase domain-containing protein [Pseudomonadales bacterium]
MNRTLQPKQTTSLSRSVLSGQSGAHSNLQRLVEKHLRTRSSRPYAPHNVDAFHAVVNAAKGRDLILDAGCGTGDSTLVLARRHPQAFVAGIDKSAKRLDMLAKANAAQREPNALLVRADLVDFFRIAAAEGARVYKNYFLYPNPWPKPAHLQRRWHGAAVFREILELGGEIELRSNWKIYAEEFAMALNIAGIDSELRPLVTTDSTALTPFEKKYHASGHSLWQLCATCPA